MQTQKQISTGQKPDSITTHLSTLQPRISLNQSNVAVEAYIEGEPDLSLGLEVAKTIRVYAQFETEDIEVAANLTNLANSRSRFNRLRKKQYLVFGETEEYIALARELGEKVKICRLYLNDSSHEWKTIYD